MIEFGVNVSADGACTPAAVAASGAKWVRLVALKNVDTCGLALAYRAAGLKTLVVFARESFPNDVLDLAYYADRLAGCVDAVQPGNESDNAGPSSWTMTQAAYATLVTATRAAFPDTLLVGCGLASGHPEWWTPELDGLVDAVSCHPYGRSPVRDWPYQNFGYVGDLLDGYRARTAHPLWVTEFGAWDLSYQAAYVGGMAATLAARSDVDVALQFCFDDRFMVPTYGLIDGQGHPRDSYAAFKLAAHGGIMPQQFNVGQGVKDAMAKAGDVPKGNETYLVGIPYSMTPGEKNLYYYSAESNEVYVSPKAP
jgi:hypothetical protein